MNLAATNIAKVAGRAPDAMRVDQGANLLALGCVLLGAAAVGLGALGLWVGDFALQWQPVPDALPARALLARGTGLVFLLLGASLMARPSRAMGAAFLSA